jgi:dihydrofolate reductase
MRRLILWNLVTLDGYFDGAEPWSIDWHEEVWGEELERFSLEQAASADLLLFGRVTYEGMARHWTDATGEIADFMNTVPKVVFSTTLGDPDWDNTRVVRNGAAAEVERLKREPGADILIFGSGSLASSLMPHGLIDEYRLGVVPVVLGRGRPLFGPPVDRTSMTLLDATPLRSGCVILKYRPRDGSRSGTTPADGGAER